MDDAALFPPSLLGELAKARILGVQAGTEHKPTGVWVVVVEGRVFVRSWNDRPRGWFQAFLREPEGSLHLCDRAVPITTRRLGDENLRKAVTAAFAAKFPTKGSAKWVAGFAESTREANTLELLPRTDLAP